MNHYKNKQKSFSDQWILQSARRRKALEVRNPNIVEVYPREKEDAKDTDYLTAVLGLENRTDLVESSEVGFLLSLN